MDIAGWTEHRCCIRHGKIYHWSDTCQTHQTRQAQVSVTENLCQGQDETKL